MNVFPVVKSLLVPFPGIHGVRTHNHHQVVPVEVVKSLKSKPSPLNEIGPEPLRGCLSLIAHQLEVDVLGDIIAERPFLEKRIKQILNSCVA